jgi:hypothetical protein
VFAPLAELLKRTREKADERYKERLNDYYKRNYGDYFNFLQSNMQGLSPETKADVNQWLEKNDSSRKVKKQE